MRGPSYQGLVDPEGAAGDWTAGEHLGRVAEYLAELGYLAGRQTIRRGLPEVHSYNRVTRGVRDAQHQGQGRRSAQRSLS